MKKIYDYFYRDSEYPDSIHELGHFLVAKWKVSVWKILSGVGPKLLSKRRAKSICCVLFPFGGFIKMAETARRNTGPPDEFLSRAPAVAPSDLCRPFFNYLLAFFCLWMVFYLGYPKFSSTIGELMRVCLQPASA
jgi:membrane-associated protease RseP (regulator of RpoE activity)